MDLNGGIIKNKNQTNYLILLIVIIAFLSAFNVYFAYHYRRLVPFREGYYTLENRTNLLDSYYDELQNMYLELRSEYMDLSKDYHQILEDIASIETELKQITNYEKTIIFSTNETIKISPGSNITLTYDLPLSGYVVCNLTSDTDIYLWIGSSINSEIYYSRQPAFPLTTTELNFTVPVSHKMYIFIANVDENQAVDVIYSIRYVY
ncbi:hypothetical protein ACFL0D_04105 [Thermoproteota archaeon]